MQSIDRTAPSAFHSCTATLLEVLVCPRLELKLALEHRVRIRVARPCKQWSIPKDVMTRVNVNSRQWMGWANACKPEQGGRRAHTCSCGHGEQPAFGPHRVVVVESNVLVETAWTRSGGVEWVRQKEAERRARHRGRIQVVAASSVMSTQSGDGMDERWRRVREGEREGSTYAHTQYATAVVLSRSLSHLSSPLRRRRGVGEGELYGTPIQSHHVVVVVGKARPISRAR
jgi:hypothetical protein